MDDIYLLARLQRKDEKALDELMQLYKSYVYVIVERIIGLLMNAQDIEEVCSDVFYKLWLSADKIDYEKGNLKTYLASIARNTAKNKLRSLKEKNYLVQDSDRIELNDPLNHLEQQELSKEIEKALNSLKLQEKLIFIKYYYYYESIKKISEDMDIKISTVKSILKRGRKKLQKYLMNRGIC